MLFSLKVEHLMGDASALSLTGAVSAFSAFILNRTPSNTNNSIVWLNSSSFGVCSGDDSVLCVVTTGSVVLASCFCFPLCVFCCGRLVHKPSCHRH